MINRQRKRIFNILKFAYFYHKYDTKGKANVSRHKLFVCMNIYYKLINYKTLVLIWVLFSVKEYDDENNSVEKLRYIIRVVSSLLNYINI